MREAYSRGSTDNITALLFDLKKWRLGLEAGRATAVNAAAVPSES